MEVFERLGGILARLLLCLVPVLVCAGLVLVALGFVPWTAMHDALGQLREHDGEAALPPSRSEEVDDGQEQPSLNPEVPPPPTFPSVQADPAASGLQTEAQNPKHLPPPSAAPNHDRTAGNVRPDAGSPSVRTVADNSVLGPVTERAVEQLRPGMTIAEVTAVIGVEGWDHWPGFHYGPIKPTDLEHQRSVAADSARWEIRIWPEQYIGPVPVEVIFRDGLAVEINR